MKRNELEQLIFDEFGILSENLFERYPSFGVYRHESNNKWFAVIMKIHISKLGINEDREVNVVNLKYTGNVSKLVRNSNGIFPAYHMNKRHWISVMLDGSVNSNVVKELLDISFEATK